MDGVIIKNMKYPKSCRECDLRRVFNLLHKGKIDYCGYSGTIIHELDEKLDNCPVCESVTQIENLIDKNTAIEYIEARLSGLKEGYWAQEAVRDVPSAVVNK